MPEIVFPSIENADEDGLLAISYEIDTNFLISAYKSGIFPWPCNDSHILWFSPPKRAILKFDKLKISKRLKRHFKQDTFTFKINTNFPEVIKKCATIKRKDKGTWITSKIINTYIDFHKEGYAHSFEVYDKNNTLVGGLYGVKIDNYFAGESMFHTVTNASKFALIKTIEYLQNQGLTWMDVQIQNSFLETFGTEEISRNEFMKIFNNEVQPSDGK